MSGYIAASKEYFRRIHIIFCTVRISISLAILSEIFIKIGNIFCELCKKTKVGVFFTEQQTYKHRRLTTIPHRLFA